MRACKMKLNSRWARRVRRQFAALCAGFNATTDYCVIRKRKYRKAWLSGMYMRKGWRPVSPLLFGNEPGVNA